MENILESNIKIRSKRIESIDLLRGIVMIIMALDHVRDYFHADAFLFNPTDLSQTNGFIFFTRWITHFCAPVFIFLTGLSAYINGQNIGKKELSAFLLKRGFWLVILEFTVVNFGWLFNIHFHYFALSVIWVIGICMMVLGILVYLPKPLVWVIGISIFIFHNLIDFIKIPDDSFINFFFKRKFYHTDFANIQTVYPIIPWIGIITLGYCFGEFYNKNFDPARRKKILLYAGLISTFLFIIIRFINIYGDPSFWSSQASAFFTFLSFLNTTKYPPSLLYSLMTLGPALIFLALSENISNLLSNKIITIGRVPMFFYIIHIYTIHLLAIIIINFTGFSWSEMILSKFVTANENLKGYGFSLGIVYLIWIILIIAIYPLCKLYENYKRNNKDKWWLSYL